FIELSEPSKVQKNMISSIQESNVDTNSLFSRLVERYLNIHLSKRLS
ncbi:26222_t:CDS:1, partial [Dentiscutata erythropus]